MRPWILLAVFLSASSALESDERTQQLAASLSREADAFRKIAPDVVGQETLFQRAMKPPKGGFHIRVGANAQKAPEPAWQERRILSEYSFAAFAGEGGAVHELRRVTAVDGRTVQDSKKAQDELAAIVTAPSDKRKKELLEQFEKYGLVGAVTDFGQLLMLFNSHDILHYEFTYRRTEMQGLARILVFGYQQIDGPEGLTVITPKREAAKDGEAARTMRIGGEVWVRENTFVPIRITVVTERATEQSQIREEASVEYSMSTYGALLPVWTEHRELRGDKVVVENKFSYADFHKFDASSQINFNSLSK
jgi:hypothetical protein